MDLTQTKFVAVVWCPDCNGVDARGCHDGGVERLEPCDTREEAVRQADEHIRWTIWKYKIEEVDS